MLIYGLAPALIFYWISVNIRVVPSSWREGTTRKKTA